MIRLTDADKDNLEGLKSHFKHCLENVDALLYNSNVSELCIEYLLRDNTTLNGYQNDYVAGRFDSLKKLHDRILMELEA
tara:strand:+ start:87 stop:323 length:237 start_codon:yes stop_codon:yes gene_type:complete